MHLEALRVVVAVAVRQVRAELGQRLAAERDHLRAVVRFHNLIELRQIEVNEAGTVGEAVVR